MKIFAFGAGVGFPVFNRLAIEGSTESMGLSGLLGSVVIGSFYTGTVFGFSSIVSVFSVSLLLLYFCKE